MACRQIWQKRFVDLEESGLIYLVDSGEGKLLIGLPLMMLCHFDTTGGLRLLTGLKHITDPFPIINEDAFECFIAEMYTFSWRLLGGVKKVTLSYLHRNLLVGRQPLLNKVIQLPEDDIQLITAQADPSPQLEKHTFKLVGVEEIRNYNDDTNIFVLQTKKRESGPDVVLPGHLQVQLKWSVQHADLQPNDPKRPNDMATFIDSRLVSKEAEKACPELPFILITPKLPKPGSTRDQGPSMEAAIKTLPEFKNVGLITGAACFKFMEPFYIHYASEVKQGL